MKFFTKIIKAIISLLMTLIIVVGSIFVILFMVGIVPYVVLSGSMEPTIETGSLCFINKHVKYEDINNEDIIAYTTNTKANVTHRVINITEEGLETKGDRNDISDGVSVNESNYIGKNIFSIPKVGFLVSALQTARGRIIVITLVIMILIASFCFDDSVGCNLGTDLLFFFEKSI